MRSRIRTARGDSAVDTVVPVQSCPGRMSEAERHGAGNVASCVLLAASPPEIEAARESLAQNAGSTPPPVAPESTPTPAQPSPPQIAAAPAPPPPRRSRPVATIGVSGLGSLGLGGPAPDAGGALDG